MKFWILGINILALPLVSICPGLMESPRFIPWEKSIWSRKDISPYWDFTWLLSRHHLWFHLLCAFCCFLPIPISWGFSWRADEDMVTTTWSRVNSWTQQEPNISGKLPMQSRIRNHSLTPKRTLKSNSHPAEIQWLNAWRPDVLRTAALRSLTRSDRVLLLMIQMKVFPAQNLPTCHTGRELRANQTGCLNNK